MRNPFDDRASQSDEEPITSLDYLKAIWQVPSGTPPREPPPEQVVTDIYHIPSTTRNIPHRSRPQR